MPVLALFVSGFAPFNEGRAFTIVPESVIKSVHGQRAASAKSSPSCCRKPASPPD